MYWKRKQKGGCDGLYMFRGEVQMPQWEGMGD